MSESSRSPDKSHENGKIRTFKYRCTDCAKVNRSSHEAESSMVHCERCGYQTVQTCEGVEIR